MDWSSFLGGVSAALTGVLATVFVTEWVESKKYGFESKKSLSLLYMELSDLEKECADSLVCLQDTYYRSWRIEKGIQVGSMLNGITIPKAPNTIILESRIEKSYELLTDIQRKGIRTMLYLIRQIEIATSALVMQAKQGNISSEEVESCMSALCVVYHTSLHMKEHKERFAGIKKSPCEIEKLVLDSLGIDIGFAACTSYKKAV